MTGVEIREGCQSLTRSNVYIVLAQMEDDGLLEVMPLETNYGKRRGYKLTDKGKEQADGSVS